MIEILNKPIYDTFLQLCGASTCSIKLCSPFVKADIIEDVFANTNPKLEMSLITNVNLMSFCKKSSDLNGLKYFIDNGKNVYTFSKLHAKYYIFDDKYTIITSANLTSSGMKRNYEYGIITDCLDLVNTSISDYDSLCFNELTGEINSEHIKKINDILDSLPLAPKYAVPNLDLDFTEHEDIFVDDVNIIISNLDGWKRAVFHEADKLKKQIFTTEDFPIMHTYLKNLYPKNENIEAKIRQQLQFLRDLGLIQFVSRGVYKKLWL
jgi:hypothetical protein